MWVDDDDEEEEEKDDEGLRSQGREKDQNQTKSIGASAS